MMHQRLLVLLFLLVAFNIHAQQRKRCATVEYHNQLLQRHPELKKAYELFDQQVNEKVALENAAKANLRMAGVSATDTTTLHTIPIVVHIIHNNADGSIGGTNISDDQVLSQIPVTNNDYRRLNADTTNTPSYFKNVAADMNFEFCMASRDPNGNATSGITRTYNPATAWDVSDDTLFKALSYWPSNKYLNIWVLAGITDSGAGLYTSGILGYSQLPMGSSLPGIVNMVPDTGSATDGIVIFYQAYGNTGEVYFPYNLGRTVTHEIGHWLGGLRHPWGDCYPYPGCCTDYVDDTPWQDSADYDYDPCQMLTTQCNGPTDTLMIQNYMQYTGDNCMNLFTQGQKQRSRIAFYNSPSRVALINSLGCTTASTSTIAPTTNSDKFTIYPNPASSSYTISYQLANPEQVVLSVYNAEGMLVNTPINTLQQAGTYTTAFSTDNMADGLYIFRFVSGGNAEVKKVIVTK